MIYGSSTINLTNQGSSGSYTGPTGSSGITGPTGPTGQSITGPEGPSGYGITGATFNISSSGVTFYIRNVGTVNIDLRGPSGADGTGFIVLHGITKNGKSILISEDQFEIDKNEVIIDQDETIFFKGIDFKSINGEIEEVTESSSLITVKGKTYDIYPMGNTGEILYLNTEGEARGARGTSWSENTKQLFITIDSTRQPIYDNDNIVYPFINTFNTWPLPNNGSTQGSSTVFNQNFSGLTVGRAINQTIVDPPFILNGSGDYITDPSFSWFTVNVQLKPFIQYQKTFLGQSGGENLYYFSNPHYYISSSDVSTTPSLFTPQKLENDYVGSCCLCSINQPNDIRCTDYVGKRYCLAQGGRFSIRSCKERDGSGDCFTEGACCANDTCNNTTYETCIKFGGVFYPNELCEKTILAGKDIFTCPSSCPTTQRRACCVKGKCYNLTEPECKSIPDSVYISTYTCPSEDAQICCNVSNYKGACCKGKDCTDGVHPETCKSNGGVFMGLGTQCEEISCCGVSYTPDYYVDTSCRVTLNDPCYKIGTRIGGGYLVGIVGIPNSCDPFNNPPYALGEPLECLCNPRGQVNGDLSEQWDFKNCKTYKTATDGIPPQQDSFGKDFITAEEYVVRTHPKIPTEISNGKKCLFKGGAPYIHQLVNAIANGIGVTWPHQSFFEGTDSYDAFAGPWSFDNQTCNIITEVSGLPTASSEMYRYLSNKFYGSRSVHILWALIIAPEDVKYELNTVETKPISWSGMFENRVFQKLTGVGLIDFDKSEFFLEPISTCVVDGLLSTRIHDAYSKDHPELWFRDYNNDGKDERAYLRFYGDKTNLWTASNRSEIESDINEFKYQYSKMWDFRNTESTAVRQISLWNQQNKYGYDDWYIPSITELNYIAYNFDKLNQEILLNGDVTHEPLEYDEYWSSTSVCRVIDWDNNNHTLKDKYDLQSFGGWPTNVSNFSYKDYYKKIGSFDSTFDFGLQICSGQRMLIQNFSKMNVVKNPLIYSQDRRDTALLRPVRRIPIIVGVSDLDVIGEYNNYDFNSCESCVGFTGNN